MFTLRENHTFKRKVTVQVPNDKGSFNQELFTAEFRAIDSDEAEHLRNEAEDGTERKLLAEVFIGFEGVKDEAGEVVEYSDQVRDQLIRIPYVSLPLINAFFEGILGRKVKN